MAARTTTLVLAMVVLTGSLIGAIEGRHLQGAKSTVDLSANLRALKQAGGCSHTIVAGDTFFALANRYGTTVAAIQAANPRLVPTNLPIGTSLRLPNCNGGGEPRDISIRGLKQHGGSLVGGIEGRHLQGAKSTVDLSANLRALKQAGACTHTIVAGDTFFALANRYGTTVYAIMAANPTLVPERLQIGTVIRLPNCNGGPVARGL